MDDKTITQLNVEQVREQFPILQRKIHGKPLVYLDNGATTQKPLAVLAAMDEAYRNSYANVHRGLHQLSMEATEAYEQAHAKVAQFINATPEEVIFTKGTTESLNLLAYSLGSTLKAGDEILLSEMEHHSNLVPWQAVAQRTGAVLRFIPVTPDGTLDMVRGASLFSSKTKIVSIVHLSNVLGTINPVKDLARRAHTVGALMIVDGAQSVPHMSVDVKDLDCDFLAFSGHKMAGPTGIGVLYGKREHLERMDPFLYGGDMIREVTFERSTWNDLPWKFEAGTPNIVGGIGLGAAVDFLQGIGMDRIEAYERELTAYALAALRGIDGLEVYGPKEGRGAVISFNIPGIHPHDVAHLLDDQGIATRGGHHCAMPLIRKMGLTATSRASFYFYNTKEEVDTLVAALRRIKEKFRC